MGQRGQRGLGGRGDHIRRARRTQTLRGGDEGGDGEALEAALELIRGTEGELALRVSALMRAPRAERLATTRTRMASTEPSLLLATP
jgi:hypothetical protein